MSDPRSEAFHSYLKSHEFYLDWGNKCNDIPHGCFEALIEKLDAVDPLRNWKLIKSAPKDGKPIMLFGNKDSYPASCFWDVKKQDWLHSENKTFKDLFKCDPTHWMPLPEPPKVKKK